jgi:hypothetical protein
VFWSIFDNASILIDEILLAGKLLKSNELIPA